MGSRMNTLPEKKLSIVYGDDVIDFELLESSSRSQKILIKVYADCRVVVSTPLNTDDKTIIEADIRKKLLPQMFRECKSIGSGMDQAKKIVEMIVQITRVGLNGL